MGFLIQGGRSSVMPFYTEECIRQRQEYARLFVVFFCSCVNHKIYVIQADRVGVQVNLPLANKGFKIKEVLVIFAGKAAVFTHRLNFAYGLRVALAVGYRNRQQYVMLSCGLTYFAGRMSRIKRFLIGSVSMQIAKLFQLRAGMKMEVFVTITRQEPIPRFCHGDDVFSLCFAKRTVVKQLISFFKRCLLACEHILNNVFL